MTYRPKAIFLSRRAPQSVWAAVLAGLILTGVGAGLCGCSTTSALPEGELLYTGIKSIDYSDAPVRKKRKAEADSAGVITAVAGAVESIGDALSGKDGGALSALAGRPQPRSLSREEEKAMKKQADRDAADFEVAKEEVDAVLAYPPNNAIFGSSSLSWPLKIGLWIHNGMADKKGKLGRWIYRKFGTEPVLVSSASPEMRTKVATNTLHNYGYFRGKVGYEILPQKNPRKAKVAYQVQAGPLFRLDSVAWIGYPHAIDSLLRAHASERLLRRGDAFSVVNLSGEQTRIESLLREHGYFYFRAAYTTFRADTVAVPQKVQLQVLPVASRPVEADHPWYIGHTYFNVREHDYDPLTNVIGRRNFTYRFSGNKPPVRAGVLRRAVGHRRGELYSLSGQSATLAKLGALSTFGQMDVSYVPRDTASTCDTLDVVVSAVMDKLYDSTIEVNATLKSNQQVGPGVSYELAKRNAFRGAEKVSFKVFGSYEWQTGRRASGDNSLLNSYELGTQLSLSFPRFIMPGAGSRRLRRITASTDFSIDADWRKRSSFFNMLSFGASMTYKWHKRETSTHELTLFSLDFDKLNHTSAAFDSIMQATPALYLSMRDQFVPSLSYTFTYQSRDWRKRPWWFQFTFKEAGNFTSACYAMAGKSFSQRNKELFGNPFAQYVKVTAEAHKLFKLSPDVSIATRLFGGVIYSYGNSRNAPYNDLFYVGGANSIRAFTVRTIGPGSFRPVHSRYSYMDQTGDIKLEANIELRARLFGDLHGAVFLDAGNVWLMRGDDAHPGGTLTASTLKNIALGTGAGLRYDLSFIVLRLDVGIGLHAPYETAKGGFYNIERFKDGLGIHFAIGYPF